MPDNGYVNGYYKGHTLGKPTQDALVPDGIVGDEVEKGTTRFGTVTQDKLVSDSDYNFNGSDEEEGGEG